MSLPVVVRPEAEVDLADAQAYYELECPGLGSDFRQAVDRTIGLISEQPQLYAEVLRAIRCAYLARFPFGVYYVAESERVVVLACIHTSRDPDAIRAIIIGR